MSLLTKEFEFTQLTAPGFSEHVRCDKYIHHTIQYTIASVDTNVVLRAEGSIDGVNWFNLASDGSDVTETTNGTDAFTVTNMAIRYIRLRFVSESGGTAATIDARYIGQR